MSLHGRLSDLAFFFSGGGDISSAEADKQLLLDSSEELQSVSPPVLGR